MFPFFFLSSFFLFDVGVGFAGPGHRVPVVLVCIGILLCHAFCLSIFGFSRRAYCFIIMWRIKLRKKKKKKTLGDFFIEVYTGFFNKLSSINWYHSRQAPWRFFWKFVLLDTFWKLKILSLFRLASWTAFLVFVVKDGSEFMSTRCKLE